MNLRAYRSDPVLLAVLAVVAVALVLRLVDLGVRAMHHDESLHAYFSWQFAQGAVYEHDPLMHGPFQFHVIAATFKLFGASDFFARLPAALAGTALVATSLFFRRWLGGAGTVAMAVFLALSPTLLYFSRFARNDIFIALWTVLLVAAVWRYRDDGRLRWLVLASVALALAFVTKEVAYLLAATVLVYVDVVLWRAYVRQRTAARAASAAESGSGGGRRGVDWLVDAALLPLAWLVAALWPLIDGLRGRLGLHDRTREGDLLVVLGTLTATQLAAGVQIPLERLGVAVEGDTELAVGWASGLTLLAGAAAVGLLWRPRWWALCFGMFAMITVPLFTTFFANPDGFGTGFWGSLDYWLEQQDVRRGEQPWFYYLMLLPIYELWLLAPVLIGGFWLLVRPGHPANRLTALFVWLFIGTFAALSVAGEKMPWLLVHLALPLAMLGGIVAGVAIPAVVRELRRPQASSVTWGVGGAAVASFALLAVLGVRSGLLVTFAHPDTPVEPLIYTQTTRDVPVLAERIVDEFDEGAGGTASAVPSRVVIDTTASLSWPWAWYLRDLPVSFASPSSINNDVHDGNAIFIVATQTIGSNDAVRSQYEAVPYRHRWWFPEEGYRSITWERLLKGIGDGSLPSEWFVFLTERIDEGVIASLDGEVLFPQAADEATDDEATDGEATTG